MKPQPVFDWSALNVTDSGFVQSASTFLFSFVFSLLLFVGPSPFQTLASTFHSCVGLASYLFLALADRLYFINETHQTRSPFFQATVPRQAVTPRPRCLSGHAEVFPSTLPFGPSGYMKERHAAGRGSGAEFGLKVGGAEE